MNKLEKGGASVERKNTFFENKINARVFGKNADFSCILLLILLCNSFFLICLRVFRRTLFMTLLYSSQYVISNMASSLKTLSKRWLLAGYFIDISISMI
jgi:uncharacterized membrane protein